MTVPGNLSSPLLAVAAAGAGAAGGVTKSVRFNSADSAHFNRTPSSAGSNTTWTLSTWVKKVGNDNHIFGAGAGNTPGRFGFGFNGSDKIFAFVIASGSTVFSITTDAVFRDHAAWYHLVLIADTGNGTQADRFKIYVNGVLQSVSGTLMPSGQNTFVNTTAAHVIGRRSYNTSDPFNGYLADFYLIDGTAKNVTDFGAFDDNGVWQVATYSGAFGTNGFHLFDFASEGTVGHDSSGNGNDFTANNITTGNTFSTNMTPSSTAYPNTTLSNGGLSWSGSVANDTGTVSSLTIPTNKKTYVEVTHTTTGGGNPGPGVAQGPTVELGLDSVKAWWRGGTDGSASSSTLGSFTGSNTSWSNGDVLGIALDHTANSGNGSITFYKNGSQIHTGGSGWTAYNDLRFEFQSNGSNTDSGTWNYGASAFSYPVSGHTGLFEGAGADEDVLRDVPVNGDASGDTGAGGELSSNYCVLNPLDQKDATLTNCNLEAQVDSDGSRFVRGTIAVSSGKYYWEFTTLSSNNMALGVVETAGTGNLSDSGSYYYYANGGALYGNSSGKASSWGGSTLAVGDVLGVALDMDNGTLQYYKNGSLIGTAWTGLTGKTLAPAIGTGGGSNNKTACNFGQRAWAYSAPTNFKALCTSNLPTPTVADGSDYFETKLWTGDGNNRTISGLSFSPDFVWMKNRSFGTDFELYDTRRGAQNVLKSSNADAEAADSSGLLSFTSDGWTLGNSGALNRNNDSIVGWAWDAGTSNASNTDGDVTSTVRANIAAGFSVVTWTGISQTNLEIGHGLGTEPHMIFAKKRNVGTNWVVYHKSIGNNKYMRLNGTLAATDDDIWGDTTPTSSVFTVNKSDSGTGTDDTYVAYCFTSVAGYSAYGGPYDGTGSTTNPAFQYCGFRPAWILIKSDSDSEDWVIYDTARGPENVVNNVLRPGRDNIEATADERKLDILSNGFKVRGVEGSINAASKSYVWWAIAENPFQANGGLAR